MCGLLSVQRILSGQLANRRFLLRPPEPAPHLLVSSPSESVYIGKTEFLRIPFFWNPEKLVNPHMCVVGITGSGKSYFVKTFITRANLAFGSGALIIDWAGEYSEWVRSAGGKVVPLGPEGLNLLDLSGASPHSRISQVMSSLEILTDISSFPRQRSSTSQAMEQAYLRRGFSLSEPRISSKKAPTLQDVIKILLRTGGKNSEEWEAARRLKQLISSSGNSFCSATIDMGGLISSNLVCIDLHSLPTEQLRSLAGLAILQFIKERMRQQKYTQMRHPRLFVVVDEAWKIAADERSDVVSIVREGRKYGFGLIVASQNPTDVSKSIFSNAGTVAAFRLTLSSERDYVRSSLSYSDFFERISHHLSVGQALFHLEFASPAPCPKTFLISRVEGEALLTHLHIRGGDMDLSFEKNELYSRLVSLGLSDRQATGAISEFERKSNTMRAHEFILSLERTGQSRASIISFLRECGAGERELLAVFSSLSGKGKSTAAISLAVATPFKRKAHVEKKRAKPRKAGALEKHAAKHRLKRL